MDLEDEDDDFVTIGDAVPQVEENEALPKAGSLATNQSARDVRGRQRFHGAFTGGFSAGYFNTVGSKTGWAPKEFSSSRQGRADSLKQSPEDFMDDEDLGEFGIAHRRVRASGGFDRTESQRKRQIESLSGGLLPEQLLESLVVPSSAPIGESLLNKMGWKQGQGVGPREKRDEDESNKMYGCSLPPSLSSKSSEFSSGLTFAPEDVATVVFQPKNNRHGIGYSGIDPKALFAVPEPPPVRASSYGKRKEMRGQAFGVGAMNEEDDDVYGQTSMTSYDTVLDTDAKRDDNYGWTAPRGHRKKGSRFEPQSFGQTSKALEGFTESKSSVEAKVTYPAPLLPPGYRPFKRFLNLAPPPGTVPTLPKHPVEKGVLLGEKIVSVFDLVSKEDQQRMKDAKEQTLAAPSNAKPTKPIVPPPDSQTVPRPEPSKPDDSRRPLNTKFGSGRNSRIASDFSSAPLGKLTPDGFDPFAADPDKADRYKRFTELQAQEVHDPYSKVETLSMTDWERIREREEFTRAAKLYAPLSSLMSARFTRGRHQDAEDVVMEPEVEDERSKAARMKMFGKLTRELFTWYPDKLICKRFNIANPYPDANIVGIPQAKRDRFSVWNYLGLPSEEARAQTDVMAIEPAPDRPKVSFAVGVAGKAGMKELNKDGNFSIFSDLPARSKAKLESEESITKDGTGQEEPAETAPTEADGRPPIDLFKAIFEDSTDSESEEETEAEKIDEKLDENTQKEEESKISEQTSVVVETKENKNNTEKDRDLAQSGRRTKKSSKFSVFDEPENEEEDHIAMETHHVSADDRTKSVIGQDFDRTTAMIGKNREQEACSVIGAVESRDQGSNFVIGADRSRVVDETPLIGPAPPPDLDLVTTSDSSHRSQRHRSKSSKKKKHKSKERKKHKHKSKHKKKSKHKSSARSSSSSSESGSDGR